LKSDRARCPSAKCKEGAELLGVVGRDGVVAYLPRPMVIDDEFVQIASVGRDPGKRFRFSDSCVEARCKQWTGTRCGVIDEIIRRLSPPATAPSLRKCAIRSTCRWFAQAGAAACSVCPLVITNLECIVER
jgi:hypothetical protein